MHEFLIKEYVKRITKEEITSFAFTQGITLTEKETDILYTYIKKDWRTFLYGNPRKLLDEIKNQVETITYNKIEKLYIEFKNKIIIGNIF